MTDRHCARFQPRTLGLVIASSTIAASPSRSSVAPTAPVTGNRCVARAAPNWKDVHDPSTSSTAVSGCLRAPPAGLPAGPRLAAAVVGICGEAAAGGAEGVIPLQSRTTD